MKHIKAPVRAIVFPATTEIIDDYGLIAVVQNDRETRETIGETAREIIRAVNAYDALVEALQAHKAVSDHVQTCSRCGDGLLPPLWRRLECAEYDRLWNAADQLTRAALEAVDDTA